MLGPGHKTFFHPEKNGAKGRKCQDAKKKKKHLPLEFFLGHRPYARTQI